MTSISWTDETWNPTTGCSHASAGCDHCYAERLSLRFGWSTLPWTSDNAAENVVLHPERLRKPYAWREPRRVFVNSMSDLFHPRVPDAFIRQVWDVMRDLPQHTFQILTKRPRRMSRWDGPWPAHIWAGTSVEDGRVAYRIDQLRQCGAAVRFVSFEPLIGPVGPLDLTGIHWAIAGGESGPGYRPMDDAWARAIRDQCLAQGVAFWFKQHAGPRPETGTTLDGIEWHQYPDALTAPVGEPVRQAVLL